MSSDTEALTASLRSFVADLRSHIAAEVEATPPEVMVERVLAVISLVGSAVMVLFPGRRKEAVLDVMIAAVLRFLARSRQGKVVDADG